jgi:hypothetical protein
VSSSAWRPRSATSDAAGGSGRSTVPASACDTAMSAASPQAVAAPAVRQLQALKRAIGAVAIFALLALWFTSGLPGRALSPRSP